MRTILLFLSLFLIISCNKQDEPKQQEQHNELYGSWYLVRFEGMIFHPPYEYTDEIMWTFDTDFVNVSIANGTDVSNYMPLRNTGQYMYVINNNHDRISFHHDNIDDSYNYNITNDTLVLDNYIGTDGIKVTLIKTN